MGDVSLPTPSLNTAQDRRVRDTAQTKGAKEQECSGNTWMLQRGIMANTDGAALLTPTAHEHGQNLHKGRETMG